MQSNVNALKNKIKQNLAFSVLIAALCITLLFLGFMIFFIAKNGIGVISWEFLTQPPRDGMMYGGIAPAIVGSFLLVMGAIVFALPLGVATAIYLQEYSPSNTALRIINLGINNLAGVPSIVFGLFGLAVFVRLFGFGVSVLSGSLTLGILILPAIIAASQEAIMAVPLSFREASLALGATQSQTITRVVVPSAAPGILTGIILAIGRAGGETAPILFTAATFYKRGFPTGPMSEVMALPYHIYALMAEGVNPERQTLIAYGCALVLLALVIIIALSAIIVRNKHRSSYGH
ncbi:MAG: phosphate ABC transporter permease PstA [Elusimicrobia bacterium]|nr:phosphate ABC transporter permease PstA [Elusimicrobiota bacterium]